MLDFFQDPGVFDAGGIFEGGFAVMPEVLNMLRKSVDLTQYLIQSVTCVVEVMDDGFLKGLVGDSGGEGIGHDFIS